MKVQSHLPPRMLRMVKKKPPHILCWVFIFQGSKFHIIWKKDGGGLSCTCMEAVLASEEMSAQVDGKFANKSSEMHTNKCNMILYRQQKASSAGNPTTTAISIYDPTVGADVPLSQCNAFRMKQFLPLCDWPDLDVQSLCQLRWSPGDNVDYNIEVLLKSRQFTLISHDSVTKQAIWSWVIGQKSPYSIYKASY